MSTKNIKKQLLMEAEKMESEIKKNENPIQANPLNPRNPKRDISADDANIPKDKEPEQLTKDIEMLEKKLKEEVKPHQSPMRKPKKSDTMETGDGVSIMNEIEEIGKRLDDANTDPQPPMAVPGEPPVTGPGGHVPDGTGPHGAGMGPGDGKGDGTGMKVDKPDDEEECSTGKKIESYLSKNKVFQHQVQPFKEKRLKEADDIIIEADKVEVGSIMEESEKPKHRSADIAEADGGWVVSSWDTDDKIIAKTWDEVVSALQKIFIEKEKEE